MPFQTPSGRASKFSLHLIRNFIHFSNPLPLFLTICSKAKYFIISSQTAMWMRGLNWEFEMLHISAHNSYYCKVAWSKPSTSSAHCWWALSNLMCPHSAMGTIANNSATVSSTSVHARARYSTATVDSSSLFFLLSRGLEYIRIKGKAHLFQLSPDLSLSIKREHNNNSTADKRELNDTHQLAVSTCRAHMAHGVLCLQGIPLVQGSHVLACLGSFWKENSYVSTGRRES